MIARSVIENIATALTENYRIKVIFRGSDCFATKKLIVLPSLPDTLPGKLVEMIRGYLDHEVAHILFSDFSLIEDAAKKGAKEKRPVKFILNAVEDVRIERKMATVYRGCGVNFDKARDLTTKKLKDKWEAATKAGDIDDGGDPIFRTMIFFILICQTGWDNPFILEYASDVMPLLEHLAPEIEATESLTDTNDAYDLALKILEKIETFAHDPELGLKPHPKVGSGGEDDPAVVVRGSAIIEEGDPDATGTPDEAYTEGDKIAPEPEEIYDPTSITVVKPEPEPESEEDSDEDEDKDEDGSDEDSDELEDKEPEPEPLSPFVSDEDEPEEPDIDEGDEGDEGDEDEPDADEDESEEPEEEEDEETKAAKELKRRLEKALAADGEREIPSIGHDISDAAKKASGYRPFSTEKDTFEPHPCKDADLDYYNGLTEKLSGIVTTLRGRLSRILLSQKRSRWDGNKRKGIINPAQLHQIITKTSDSVYRVRKDGVKLNTAVSILIDLSGSMGGKMEITRQTTALMAETLTKIGIPFEILGFSGDHSSHTPSEGDRKIFNRWGTLDIFYFKKFDEYFGQDQKKRIGGMAAHRENYDGESVLFAATRLKARPERKKILFVLSDGMPCASRCKSATLNTHLRSVVRDLERDPSMVLVAFGMRTDAPKHFYSNYLLVNDLQQFPEVLMANLYKTLM